jgi:Fe-S oxidoreductase/nitrate reductase gamma subunit
LDAPIIPVREVFRNFPALLVVVFYLVSGFALGVFGRGLWVRIRKYRTGRPAWRTDRLGARLLEAVGAIALHTTLRKRDAYVGWGHALIFGGFVLLIVGTLIVALDHDLLKPLMPALQFWKGTFYLWYSLILDLAGVALLAGLSMMAVRRWYSRPLQLDYTRADRSPGEYGRGGYQRDDQVFLWGLMGITITGFLNESLRIVADRPSFEVWSVVGWQLAVGLDALGLTPVAASHLHMWGWWLHALLALAFVAYIPYSKAIHMLAGLANLVFKDPLAGRRLPGIPDGAERMGYAGLADFTWKDLLDLDACTKCGRCHIACPARAGGWPLSPRDLILGLREHAESVLGGGSWWHETPRASGSDDSVTGTVVTSATLWSCTTCLACIEACPVGIEHVPLIVQMRRRLVEEGIKDRTLMGALEKLGRFGNSFGEPERNRAKWSQELGFRIKDAAKEPVEYLWFVGDYASYHPSVQAITRSVARIFNRAGLDFGILHQGERNAGNDVRRVGEEGLYQSLVEHNLAALARADFKEIITTDPHTYNTLKFEYPAFGGSFRIRHYTEVVRELLDTGRLPLARRLEMTVTYHDPCHLSRYTQMTEASRAILAALGLRLVEMQRHGANSFCCGAGGGRIWMTGAGVGERPAEQRIREALSIEGVSCLVVACPKDLVMFRDAAKTTGNEKRLPVRDLIELVEEAVTGDPGPLLLDQEGGAARGKIEQRKTS